MTQQSRILLSTPGGSKLQPAEPRIKCGEGSDLARAFSGPSSPDFDYWAMAFIASRFKSDVLLDAIDASDGKSILLLPLHDYEWIGEVRNLPPRMLALLPGIGIGALMVVPIEFRPALQRPHHDAIARDELAQFSRRNFPVHIVVGPTPVAAPLHRFALPPLAPNAGGDLDWTAPYFSDTWLNEVEDSSPNGVAIKAGILQLNNRLDDSHTLAQSIEGHPDADYWHAIMHRREPDYGNSKYWFHHVGRHPVFAQLAPRAAEILNDAPADIRSNWEPKLTADSGWDPFAFVNMCEAGAADENGDVGMTARRIQWIEMLLLLKHTARRSGSA